MQDLMDIFSQTSSAPQTAKPANINDIFAAGNQPLAPSGTNPT